MKSVLQVCASMVLSVAAAIASAQNAAPAPPAPEALPSTFDSTRDAMSDLKAAQAIAHSTHKRILADLGGEWCEACRDLDTFFDANPDLREQRDAAFVWLKVNYSGENKNVPFTDRMPFFFGYPHWFVLDENGAVLKSSFAKFERQDFTDFVRKWALKSD